MTELSESQHAAYKGHDPCRHGKPATQDELLAYMYSQTDSKPWSKDNPYD
jgi:hypothetical protein